MVNYILLSCLLSMIGGVLYFGLLRRYLQVLYAKYTLLVIILLSWLVPVMVPSLPNYASAVETAYLFDYKEYNRWNVVDLDDKKLLICYAKSRTSKELCHCEIEQKSAILLYQYNPFYSFIIYCKSPVFWLFVGMMSLFLVDFILKLCCLFWLVSQSPKEKQYLAGITFYLLRPIQKMPLAISSFTLFRHYIIVHQDLEKNFSEEEVKAILLHEVAHLRQRDTWQQMLFSILKMFWWMQPMFYWFKKELQQLNEFVADDFAAAELGNSKFYAKTLLKAKEQQLHHQQLSFVMCFAQGLFKQRIVRLVATSSQPPNNNWLAACIFVGLVFWTISAATLPILQVQDINIKQYELLQAKNSLTGQQEFCKSCLIMELKNN